jgi:3-oxoacyl-[acyl-carrier-protein] synthase-3
MAKKILVMGAEVLTSIVDFSDRNTCILFGDGAGAAVVEATDSDEQGILSTHVFTNGAHWGLLYQPGVGVRNKITDQRTHDEKLYYLRMEGNEVFKHAVRAMGDAAAAALNHNGVTADDLALLIPHQANRRIIEATGKRIGLPEEKIFVNLHKYGNTSAASIPLALDEANREGRIKTGDLILLDAFGGGFTYGSALLKW